MWWLMTEIHVCKYRKESFFPNLCIKTWLWLTLPVDLIPLTSAAADNTVLSSRQRAKCQTTGPVSSRPPDLCRATRLKRRDIRLYSNIHMTDVRKWVCLLECEILTPSTARSGSALELWLDWMKDKKCCFPASSCPLKHHSHCNTLQKKDTWVPGSWYK